jgi:proteasome lid subunit RPN8/RPN11
MLRLQDVEVFSRRLLDEAINSSIGGLQTEMCGYFIKDINSDIFYQMYENTHADPVNNFSMAETCYIDASKKGEVIGLFHSHINGNSEFSDIDKASCERLGIPWVLYVIPTEEIIIKTPSGWIAPYTGREFVYGVFDCYALVKDVYKQNLGIQLSDYPRGKVGEWNDNSDWNFFVDNFGAEGFTEVARNSVFKKYDILLMQIGSRKFNHCAIAWEPSKNTMLHHLLDRFSSIDVFGGMSFRVGKRLRYSRLIVPTP